MSPGARALLICAALLVGSCAHLSGPGQPAWPSGTFAVVGVRLFDGAQTTEGATVLVREGRVLASGVGVAVPMGTPVVEGRGRTLLPGLIDAHMHVNGPRALEACLAFGVTTALDMFTDLRLMRWLAAHPSLARADWRSAGAPATTPDGHGTEYGWPVPGTGGPGEAQAFVDARLAEGSSYLKLVLEDGSLTGHPLPSLDEAEVTALVAAAHQRGRLAVVHATTQAAQALALRAGADGLMHSVLDRAPEPELLRLLAERRPFLVPTLTAHAAFAGHPLGPALPRAPAFAPYLGTAERARLRQRFHSTLCCGEGLSAARSEVRAALRLGLPVLAGSDAPVPGTTHGASLHQELAQLVEAGLTPTQALAAATSAPAEAFHLGDRGRIAPGLRADLLLVEGDPTREIGDTARVVAVWREGVPFDRQAYRERLEPESLGGKP